MDCWPERLNWAGLDWRLAGQCSCDNSRRLFERTTTLLYTHSDRSTPAIHLVSPNRSSSLNHPFRTVPIVTPPSIFRGRHPCRVDS